MTGAVEEADGPPLEAPACATGRHTCYSHVATALSCTCCCGPWPGGGATAAAAGAHQGGRRHVPQRHRQQLGAERAQEGLGRCEASWPPTLGGVRGMAAWLWLCGGLAVVANSCVRRAWQELQAALAKARAETEEAITSHNKRYNDMIAERMRLEDSLTEQLAAARAELEAARRGAAEASEVHGEARTRWDQERAGLLEDRKVWRGGALGLGRGLWWWAVWMAFSRGDCERGRERIARGWGCLSGACASDEGHGGWRKGGRAACKGRNGAHSCAPVPAWPAHRRRTPAGRARCAPALLPASPRPQPLEAMQLSASGPRGMREGSPSRQVQLPRSAPCASAAAA
jgi:hypothetical protein